MKSLTVFFTCDFNIIKKNVDMPVKSMNLKGYSPYDFMRSPEVEY